MLKLEATINVRMPVTLFEMIKTTFPDVNAAVALGYLIPDGDDLRMKVVIDGGVAKINGAPMKIPMPGA